MRIPIRLSFAVLLLLSGSRLAFAQASIAGQVKDSSGAVLPGVTVEASSPALIEKVRSTTTDGNGQYRIEDLRPGTYEVTFSLPGFASVKRQGIELTGTFTATVNAELRVGAVAETITVTGETPVVDVINAKQQATVTNEVINAVPTARLYHSLVTLVPGVTVSGTQDVGGISGPTTVTFSMRGGPGNEGRLTVDGLSLGASLNGTGVSYTVADVGNAQEIVFTTAGQLGESEVGGPSMNLVPRQGGNRFSGQFFANGANDKFASTNYTPELKDRGLQAPVNLLKIWDVNLGVGGPIRRDRLWHRLDRRWDVEERERTADLAGDRAEQVQRLLGRAAALHVLLHRGDGDHRAGGALQQPRPAARPAGDVVVAEDQPSAARGGVGQQPHRRLRNAAEHLELRADDPGRRGLLLRVPEQRRDSRAGVPIDGGRALPRRLFRRQRRLELAGVGLVGDRPQQREDRLHRPADRQPLRARSDERLLDGLHLQQRRALLVH